LLITVLKGTSQDRAQLIQRFQQTFIDGFVRQWKERLLAGPALGLGQLLGVFLEGAAGDRWAGEQKKYFRELLRGSEL
jgi:hypothetical protein